MVGVDIVADDVADAMESRDRGGGGGGAWAGGGQWSWVWRRADRLGNEGFEIRVFRGEFDEVGGGRRER